MLRFFNDRRPKPAVVQKALALEDRLRNARERGKLAEGARWENRLRLLAAWQRGQGHREYAADLEEVVDELAGKGR